MTVKKLCPKCGKQIDVDNTAKTGICELCGVNYRIVQPRTDAGIKHAKGGIKLRYDPEEKICSLCHEQKPIAEFHKNTNASDDHASWCKSCVSKENKKLYKKNYHAYKVSDGDVPSVARKDSLGSVLSYLIRVSARGVNANKILNESIAEIKELLA